MRYAWALGFWCLGLLGALFYCGCSGCTPVQMFVGSLDWLAHHPWGPVVYLIGFCCRPLTLLPASLFSTAAGFCFGLGWGMLWAHLAGTLAALLFYGLGYHLGLPQGWAPWWDRWLELLRRGGATSLIVLRFCFLPYDPVSYLGGALRLRPLAFIFANLLGNFPGTTSCVLLGASMQGGFQQGKIALDWRMLGGSWVMLIFMVGLARRLRRRTGAEPHTDSQGAL